MSNQGLRDKWIITRDSTERCRVKTEHRLTQRNLKSTISLHHQDKMGLIEAKLKEPHSEEERPQRKQILIMSPTFVNIKALIQRT